MIEQMKAAANTKNERIAAGILEKHYQLLNNPWLSWPSNALIAGDDFFKSLAARYRMYSKAKFEALAKQDAVNHFKHAIKLKTGTEPADVSTLTSAAD